MNRHGIDPSEQNFRICNSLKLLTQGDRERVCDFIDILVSFYQPKQCPIRVNNVIRLEPR